MFFMAPAMYILGIYVLAAVLPAVFLMRYIYRQDQIEPEPPGLLIVLIFSGVAAALCSIVLEMLAEGVLNLLVDPGSPTYTILLAFLVVAVVEEGTKLFFLKRRSWNSPAFNYRFDGVVYAVFVSLGFAVFMGAFYGRARLRFNRGDETGGAVSMAAGYLIAVFLHGFYDTCAMLGTSAATAAFVVFVVVMYIVVFRLIRRESLEDQPLY